MKIKTKVKSGPKSERGGRAQVSPKKKPGRRIKLQLKQAR